MHCNDKDANDATARNARNFVSLTKTKLTPTTYRVAQNKIPPPDNMQYLRNHSSDLKILEAA